MIRLEKADMEGEALAALAKTANMSPGDFKKRYAVAVE